MTQAEKQQRIGRFEAAHRRNGLSITTQRRAVFEALQDRLDHPTAEQVYQVVRAALPQISRMTVYRILGTLVSLGLVEETCHPGSAARFDPNLDRHHHLVCVECGDIIDIEEARLNQLRWPKVAGLGFQIESYEIHFRGRCARCRRKAKNSRAVSRPRTAHNKSNYRAKEANT